MRSILLLSATVVFLSFAPAPAAAQNDGRGRSEMDKHCPSKEWQPLFKSNEGAGGLDVRYCKWKFFGADRWHFQLRNTTPHPLKVDISLIRSAIRESETAYVSVNGRYEGMAGFGPIFPDVRVQKVEAFSLWRPSALVSQTQASSVRQPRDILLVKEEFIALDTRDMTAVGPVGPVADASTMAPRSGVDAYTSPMNAQGEDPVMYNLDRNRPRNPVAAKRSPTTQVVRDAAGQVSFVTGAPTIELPAGMVYQPSITFLNKGEKTIRAITWECNFYEGAGRGTPLKSYRQRRSYVRGKDAGVGRGEFGYATMGKKVRREVMGKAHEVAITEVEYSDGTKWKME